MYHGNKKKGSKKTTPKNKKKPMIKQWLKYKKYLKMFLTRSNLRVKTNF